MMRALLVSLALAVGLSSGAQAAAGALPAAKLLVLPSQELPITSFNVTFRVGSADDPKGAEGLAWLTARLLREGGVREVTLDGTKLPARSRAELEDYLYPFAADIDVSAEKEQISFRVTATGDDAQKIFDVLAQLVLAPAFDEGELGRLKAETLDALTKALPREDEEELGKAALENRIWGAAHPYGHVTLGTVEGVKHVDVDRIREFYQAHFTRARVTVGLAGLVSDKLRSHVEAVFAALPEGTSDRANVPAVAEERPLRLTLVKGPFDAVGVHLGQPIPINRASPDFAGMYLASWAFGKHRSFVGRLMHNVREVRGLNYGSYSYVEELPHGGSRLSEPTQAARTRQDFTIWGRPAVPANGCFLLRQLYREAKSLASQGLTSSEFSLTQSHLVGAAPLLATGLERRLGYAIDSRFYGIEGDYLKNLQTAARQLTRAKVNALLRKYLRPESFELVVVTSDPAQFRKELASPACPITYGAGIKKPREVLTEDEAISHYKIDVRPENIQEIDSGSLFAQ